MQEEQAVEDEGKSRQSATVLIVTSAALVIAGVSKFVFGLPGAFGGVTIGAGVGGLVYALIVRRRYGGLLDIDREAGEARRAARPAWAAGLAVGAALVAIEVSTR